MLDVIDVSRDVMPIAALIDALSAEPSPFKREQLLARLREQQDEARAALKEQADALDKVYEDARRDAVDPARLAEIAIENERADAERVRPAIRVLQQKLTARGATLDPWVRQSVQESLDILEAWLPLYQGLRERLLKLAAERRNGDEVLRAKPVVGDIDYAELSREHIARYPKIRAALAK
jgi:hypothetical protein